MLPYMWYLKNPEEGFESTKAAYTGICELPDLAAGNHTRVLEENKNSWVLRELSNSHLISLDLEISLYNERNLNSFFFSKGTSRYSKA